MRDREFWNDAELNRYFPLKVTFESYHKYEFRWENNNNPSFKVTAIYGGDPDRIYRYPVSNNDYLEIKSIEDLRRTFTTIEIHNYTNECIYYWED